MMNKAQRHDSQPYLQGERSHRVCRDVQGLHRRGVRARTHVTTNPACFGLRCKQATLILNVPDLKWEQVNSDGRRSCIIYSRKVNITLSALLPTQFRSSLWNTVKIWSKGFVCVGMICSFFHDAQVENRNIVSMSTNLKGWISSVFHKFISSTYDWRNLFLTLTKLFLFAEA